MPRQFDHENLNVYHTTLRFVVWITGVLERVPKNLAVHSQLNRASTSMPLNFAEGSGKWTAPDRCRFFDNARGSALECAAALDVLVAKGIADAASVADGKACWSKLSPVWSACCVQFHRDALRKVPVAFVRNRMGSRKQPTQSIEKEMSRMKGSCTHA